MKRIVLLAIALYAGLCSAQTTQQWLQQTVDSDAAKAAKVVSLRAVLQGGAEVLVTPTPPLVTLTNLKDGGTYTLQPGTVYAVSNTDVRKNLTLIGASEERDKWVTVRFPDCWTSPRTPGPDCGSPDREGTLKAIGCTIKLRNLRIVGGEDVIALGSDANGSLDVDNVECEGAMWRGSGGNKIRLRYDPNGKPHGYHCAAFTYRVKDCLIESLSGVPFQQGGVFFQGKPQGETTFRVCNADVLEYRGIKTVPWFHEPGKIWKQDIQIRPRTKQVRLVGCEFYLPDIGDIALRPSHPVALPVDFVDFIGCTLAREPHYTKGAKTVKFTDTKVAGETWNKTVQK